MGMTTMPKKSHMKTAEVLRAERKLCQIAEQEALYEMVKRMQEKQKAERDFDLLQKKIDEAENVLEELKNKKNYLHIAAGSTAGAGAAVAWIPFAGWALGGVALSPMLVSEIGGTMTAGIMGKSC